MLNQKGEKMANKEKKEQKKEEPQKIEETPKKKGKFWGDPLITAE